MRSFPEFVNDTRCERFQLTLLPDYMLVYYSGHNMTIPALLAESENKFRDKIKNIAFSDARFLIGVDRDYKELFLYLLLTQAADSMPKKYIKNKLGIETLGMEIAGTGKITEPVVELILQRPFYAVDTQGSSKHQFDIIDNDDLKQRYWHAKGISKDFLSRLEKCIIHSPGGMIVTEGFFPIRDQYRYFLSIEKIQSEFSDYSTFDMFCQWDNLKTIGMLNRLSIPIKLNNGRFCISEDFSDGQFQCLYIYAISEIFKEKNGITLLDEPDSFLHPEWQAEFMQQINDITSESSNNHILMTSHSATTLACPICKKINFIDIDNETNNPKIIKETKKKIIASLSNNQIQYSEDESKLLIDNAIRSSNKPVLFVEGITDVYILNTAYKKLYDGEDIPFLVQDVFSRGNIKVYLSHNQIYLNYPNKMFFGLFDFDEAYDDWRELQGEIEPTISKGSGLCKKLTDKQAYAFMMPVPDAGLQNQVWNESNPIEKVIQNPVFGIEHIFWGNESLRERWFKESNGCIIFKKDKVKFAKEIVPTLRAEAFEPFKTMFEFIKSKICESGTSYVHL